MPYRFSGEHNISPFPLLETPWASHNLVVYNLDKYKQNLSKYTLDLPHLATNTQSTTNQPADTSALSARLDQLESDLPALESTLISYADTADTSLSNALLAEIESSIGSFSNGVDWASIGSIDTNEINSRIDGISYINTLLADEISTEIQAREAAITSLEQDIVDLTLMVNSVTNSAGGLSMEQAQSMMQDLRVGSSIIDVSNQQATITITLDQSSNLTSNWTENVMSVPITIDAHEDTQFYRFRMD